jgi:hypothetical protein
MKRLVLAIIVAAVVAAPAGTARAGGTGPLILPAPQAPSSSPDSFCPPTGCGGGGGGWTCYNHPAYGGYYSYAGYQNYGVAPAAGSSISATVRMNYDWAKYSGNHVAAWAGVVNSSGNYWIQAGVDEEYTGGLRLYIEDPYDGGTHDMGPASYGTNYAVTITHVSGTTWKATVGGHSLGNENTNMTGYTSQFTSESFDLVPTDCNYLDATFSSIGPWARASLGDITDYDIDYLQNKTTYGWESVQP